MHWHLIRYVKLPSLYAGSLLMTPRLPGNPNNIFDASVLTRFSDIESRRDAIINMAKNKANAPHTILLVGGTGLGNSSLVELIANTLLSRDGYDLASLDRANERGPLDSGTRTVSPHLYEIASELGVLVSINVMNVVRSHNLSPRFVSSKHPDSPALTVLSTTNS